jgi:site-specific DNA-methyltransferase (adenine-specific)
MPLKIHENVLVFYKKPPTYNPQMSVGFKSYKNKVSARNLASSNYGDSTNDTVKEVCYEGRFPISMVEFSRDKNKLHPTQKPVALLEYLIKTYTNEGEVVLDNCMGSGSTCVAAVNTGRHYIGFELDPGYFDIACQRLDEAEGKVAT